MVSETIKVGLTAVEQKLQSVVASDIKLLEDAGLHIITSGGKRLRPQIVLLAYLAAGGTAWETAVPMAAAVEMVHTATLVHDDINDHSLTRRGKITVHAKWGRTFALLTGDYLFTKVYEMMAPYGSPYNVLMAEACTRLVEGETLQAAAAKAGNMDRETYKTIISRKTASLFEASAKMGALWGGASNEMADALGVYAYNLGLTFQIVDDILDIVGDPETMGKPVGLDVEQGRGVMMAQNGDHGTLTQEAVAELDPIQQMLSSLRESGAVEVARMQAYETAERARAALQKLPESEVRHELFQLIDRVLERDR